MGSPKIPPLPPPGVDSADGPTVGLATAYQLLTAAARIMHAHARHAGPADRHGAMVGVLAVDVDRARLALAGVRQGITLD